MKITRNKKVTIEDVARVSLGDALVEMDEETKKVVQESHRRLVDILNSGKPVYGINTGFGIFANKAIDIGDIEKLNRNLILSHAVGIGAPLADEIVRAAMFIRAVTLSKGFSGIRLEIIQTILDMLNKGVLPIVPSKGSLGSPVIFASFLIWHSSYLQTIRTWKKNPEEPSTMEPRKPANQR
jgi:histidine ammonia-lyase